MTTTTTTSGAAIQRYKIGYREDERGQRSSTPGGIPDASGSWVRYADHVNALAAGQATAAQQGVAYAALPDEGEPWRGHKFKEVQRGCWRCDCGKTIKEVTSGQSTPASGGNYPVMPKRYTVDDDGEELFTADKLRAFADATCALRASHGQAPAQAASSAVLKAIREANMQLVRTGDDAFMLVPYKAAKAQAAESVPAPPPPPECETEAEKRAFAFGWFKALESARMKAESVQEDAARYRWLAASCRSTSEHWGGRWSIIIDGPAPKSHDSEDDFDAAVDAARKQGATT